MLLVEVGKYPPDIAYQAIEINAPEDVSSITYSNPNFSFCSETVAGLGDVQSPHLQLGNENTQPLEVSPMFVNALASSRVNPILNRTTK